MNPLRDNSRIMRAVAELAITSTGGVPVTTVTGHTTMRAMSIVVHAAVVIGYEALPMYTFDSMSEQRVGRIIETIHAVQETVLLIVNGDSYDPADRDHQTAIERLCMAISNESAHGSAVLIIAEKNPDEISRQIAANLGKHDWTRLIAA